MNTLQNTLSTPHLDIAETDAKKDWAYLSEGGATIVFTYVGPFHPEFTGLVLRLRKCGREQEALSVPRLAPEVEERDDPSIVFQEVVTSKLIPSEHLPQLRVVKVSSQWLRDLREASEVQRPVKRSTKDTIDATRQKGVLATDLVGGKGWAIEIKPKWGFLPSSEYLSSTTLPLKTQHCRYCMHSHLKAPRQEVEATRYCPLDLYSGDEERIRTALRSLWDMWIRSLGQANNLRIFNEGKVVSPIDEPSLIGLFRKLHGDDKAFTVEELCSAFIEAALPLILNKGLISILGRLQRTLDSLDIEGIDKLWSEQFPELPIGHSQREPSMDEWNLFVQQYLSDGEVNLRYHLLSYLLSATFKDCSVIIRLHPDTEAENSITVIDLDPKDLGRLPKWFALDQEIVRNFAGVASGNPVCVDANRAQS